jgi:hypothetical protein
VTATASSIECTPSFAMRLHMWVRTVCTERWSCFATASRCAALSARQAAYSATQPFV